jgi:hypothetical protein
MLRCFRALSDGTIVPVREFTYDDFAASLS